MTEINLFAIIRRLLRGDPILASTRFQVRLDVPLEESIQAIEISVGTSLNCVDAASTKQVKKLPSLQHFFRGGMHCHLQLLRPQYWIHSNAFWTTAGSVSYIYMDMSGGSLQSRLSNESSIKKERGKTGFHAKSTSLYEFSGSILSFTKF